MPAGGGRRRKPSPQHPLLWGPALGQAAHPVWPQREPRGPPSHVGSSWQRLLRSLPLGRGSPTGTHTRITWRLVNTQRAGGACPCSLVQEMRGAREPACLTGPRVPLPGMGPPLENRGPGEPSIFGKLAGRPRCHGWRLCGLCVGQGPAHRYLDALGPVGGGPARQTPWPRGSLGPGGGDLHFGSQLYLHLPFGCFHGNVDCNAGG